MAGPGEGGSHPRMAAGYPGQTQEQHEGVKESARETASPFVGSAEQIQDKAHEGLREGLTRMTVRAEDMWQDAKEFVRRYPLASLAAAFGLGCLAGTALIALSRSSTDDMAKRMSRASS